MARIIIVDDEPSILKILELYLTSHNYTVIAVQESDRAKEMLESEQFDLMITDLRMRPIHGLQLLKHAKKECPEMGVIMMTAFYEAETYAEALREGAIAFLSKPFDAAELIDIVQQAVPAA